jgi:hypothetical protein
VFVQLLKMAMANETLREQTTLRTLTSLEWWLGDTPLCVGVHVSTTQWWHIKVTSWSPMRGELPSRWQEVTKGTKNGCFKVRWNPIVSNQSNLPQGNLVLPKGKMFSSQGRTSKWLGYKTWWKWRSAKRP